MGLITHPHTSHNQSNWGITVSIDLLYAKLGLWTTPENLNISLPSLLLDLDEKSMLSLNGSRVTDKIMHMVPNVQNFQTTLRCIGYWSKQRGIY